jgi:integrase
MAHRSIARAWNASAIENPAWPERRLTEPPLKAKEGPAWDEFPEGLRRDIDKHLAGLAKMRKGANGKRSRPCSPRTITTRRAELVAVARMAVRIGTPIETLTSFAALLDPDVVGPVLDAYWNKNGAEPNVYTIDLGWKLLSLARQVGLGEESIERLDDIRASLEERRHGGLTGKNLTLIRQVLTEGIWSEVVSLPNALMRRARADQAHAPVKAAVTAQLAVAIAILCFAPIRLTNLVSIELDKNLIKPGGPNSPFWLVFPHYDVKNRVNLEFTFDEALTGLIDEYIHEFRPTLVRGSNAAWLFPGVAGEPKTANMFSTQITERIQKATGLRMTVHQFRHACAAIYLKHRPGEYEVVRRLLGHRNIQTTINFYCGLETTQANEAFGKIIHDYIKFDDAA